MVASSASSDFDRLAACERSLRDILLDRMNARALVALTLSCRWSELIRVGFAGPLDFPLAICSKSPGIEIVLSFSACSGRLIEFTCLRIDNSLRFAL